MLSELKSKAIEAEEEYCKVLDRACEWEKIVDCSASLSEFLDLNISNEAKWGVNILIKVRDEINELLIGKKNEAKERILEYALSKTLASIGDIIDYYDYAGRKRAIIFEEAEMQGQDLAIYGTRYLLSGKLGASKGLVCVDRSIWTLRKC